MKKGKLLESLVRIVQEALKDNPKTKIHKNYEIENAHGRKREIDILIETSANSFPIVIAIECKEYNKKVPVEKIEAFESKCRRLNKIDKKVVVSIHGFQLDAINAAKDFNILLYTVKELNKENISDLILSIPIRSIGRTMKIQSIKFDFDGEISDEIRIQQKKGIAYFKNEVVSLKEIVTKALKLEGKKLDEIYIKNFGKIARTVRDKYEFYLNHKIQVDGLYFKKGLEDRKIKSINVSVQHIIENKLHNKQNFYSYKENHQIEDIKIARHLASETNDYIDIIKSEKDGLLKVISSDKDGNFVEELEHMFFLNENNQLVRKVIKNL